MTYDDRARRVRIDGCAGRRNPTFGKGAITVEKLDELGLRVFRPERHEAFVSSTRS